MSQAAEELTSPCRASKGETATDKHLVEACGLFAECVAEFGRTASAMDGLSPEEDTEELLASTRRLHAEWRSLACNIIETPSHHPAGTDAKVEALSAYFVHVYSAIECIGLDLARSLVADLKRAGNR